MRNRGLLAALCCVSGLVGCETRPSTETPTATTPSADAPKSVRVVKEFLGTIDLEKGTLTVVPAPGELGTTKQGLQEANVVQDGKAGTGPAESVELVTTNLAQGANCGGGSLDADVTLRSFYTSQLQNVHVEFTRVTPAGRELCNSETVVPPGLSNQFGLVAYGTLNPNAAASRTWQFKLPDQTNFMFKGRVMADIGPSCTDGIQNQGETGIDCGGPCAACPTCSDGIQNQGETGIDCGGPCAACPTCSDGIRNQGETGIDCGGPCPACGCGSPVMANMFVWLKADAITLSDGSPVAAWPDSSGNGRNAMAPAGQPTFRTGVVNGLPVVRFSGVQPVVFGNMPIPPGGYSYFIVWSRTNAGGSDYVLGRDGGTYMYLQYGSNWYVGNRPLTVPMAAGTFFLKDAVVDAATIFRYTNGTPETPQSKDSSSTIASIG
ncbi:MAG: hypothetical protein HY901_10580, partial [Deltaproteobacteria bacterium]|nr:hypothetical protein [Deltaproteobacteria bacterium]